MEPSFLISCYQTTVGAPPRSPCILLLFLCALSAYVALQQLLAKNCLVQKCEAQHRLFISGWNKLWGVVYTLGFTFMTSLKLGLCLKSHPFWLLPLIAFCCFFTRLRALLNASLAANPHLSFFKTQSKTSTKPGARIKSAPPLILYDLNFSLKYICI